MAANNLDVALVVKTHLESAIRDVDRLEKEVGGAAPSGRARVGRADGPKERGATTIPGPAPAGCAARVRPGWPPAACPARTSGRARGSRTNPED